MYRKVCDVSCCWENRIALAAILLSGLASASLVQGAPATQRKVGGTAFKPQRRGRRAEVGCSLRFALLALAVSFLPIARAVAQGPPQYQNPPGDFGHLNQRSLNPNALPGKAKNLGSYACGPVSLANSFVYLENLCPTCYMRCLIPDDNPNNGMIDIAEVNKVAVELAQPAYMDAQPGGALPNDDYDPEKHGAPSQGQVSPGQWGGGVEWNKFAQAKEDWVNVHCPVPPPTTNFAGQYHPDGNDPIPLPAFPPWVTIKDGTPGRQPMNIAGNIAAKLKEGCDVEIGFRWQRFNGMAWVNTNGGHFVTAYGFEFTDNNPNNGEWDPGEPVTGLKIIDPWGPAPVAGMCTAPPASIGNPCINNTNCDNPLGAGNGICSVGPLNNALQITAALAWTGAEWVIGPYVGGAGGPMIRGRIKFWASECHKLREEPIPAVSEWGLLVLTLIGLAAGTILLRRGAEIRQLGGA